MNEENTQKLIDRMPEAFSRGGEPSFYFSVDDGWFKILDILMDFISSKAGRWKECRDMREQMLEEGKDVPAWLREYMDENPEDPWANFTVDQVKEKFGGLRFYVSCCPSSEVFGAINMTEALSYWTCEVCGNKGSRRRNGNWLKTLCDECQDRLYPSDDADANE